MTSKLKVARMDVRILSGSLLVNWCFNICLSLKWENGMESLAAFTMVEYDGIFGCQNAIISPQSQFHNVITLLTVIIDALHEQVKIRPIWTSHAQGPPQASR